MLKWALVCLALAVAMAAVAGVGLAGAAMALAKALFFAGLMLFVVLVGLAGASRRPT